MAEDEILLPGATDLHVHLRDWEESYKETVSSGTLAALSGGVTTVVEMPNTKPPIDNPEALSKRLELLESDSYVDCAVHVGLPRELQILSAMRREGAIGVKLYPKDFPRLREAFRAAHDQSLKLAVHAEDPEALVQDPVGPRAEENGVKEVCKVASRVGNVRFCHVSLASSVSAIAELKAHTNGVSFEVTPHHALLSCGPDYGRLPPSLNVRPPLRRESDRIAMFEALRNGVADFYATDHAPHTASEKESQNAPPGFRSLKFAYPLLLTALQDVAMACRLYCERPAAYLGESKGKIEPGMVADLVVFRTRTRPDGQEPEANSDEFDIGETGPFAGRRLGYKVEQVYEGGVLSYSSETGPLAKRGRREHSA